MKLLEIVRIFRRQSFGNGCKNLPHLHQRSLEVAERLCQLRGMFAAFDLDSEITLTRNLGGKAGHGSADAAVAHQFATNRGFVLFTCHGLEIWAFGTQKSSLLLSCVAAYSPLMTDNKTIKDRILESALPDVPFDGWTDNVLERAAINAGFDAAMVQAVFPRGVRDALVHFSGWVDGLMFNWLKETDPASLKIRERVALAVRTRFEVLEPYREAERLAIAHWMRPFRKIGGAKLVWKTADAIWLWAGDTATDYNHYTKRALLSGVLTSTAFFWLNDQSPGRKDSWSFLARRIDNVLSVGKIVGRFKTA